MEDTLLSSLYTTISEKVHTRQYLVMWSRTKTISESSPGNPPVEQYEFENLEGNLKCGELIFNSIINYRTLLSDRLKNMGCDDYISRNSKSTYTSLLPYLNALCTESSSDSIVNYSANSIIQLINKSIMEVGGPNFALIESIYTNYYNNKGRQKELDAIEFAAIFHRVDCLVNNKRVLARQKRLISKIYSSHNRAEIDECLLAKKLQSTENCNYIPKGVLPINYVYLLLNQLGSIYLISHLRRRDW
jgi:hypothetical protein